ncbi:DUF11 domain-containing protein [Shewanella marina]|uniref:DUF11 domain-containing protein n=1 Tax=Shewanella marina TaxID=487319 RepID=UPI000471256B|nr:DUF11 domain-containing protein [Shewanella marina]
MINTGNSNDSFRLTYPSTATSLTQILLYPDVNSDGIADVGAAAINSGDDVGPLSPGENYHFVAIAQVSNSASISSSTNFTITAQSVASLSGTDTASGQVVTKNNTDTINITDHAVMEVTKKISANQGAAGTGPYTVTLTYNNVGLQDAKLVEISDQLPAGMSYVADSAQWSLLTDALTDAESDTQGTAPNTIDYCAFDTNNADCSNKVVIQLPLVSVGNSATVSFDVNIDSGIAAQILYNQADFDYDENDDGTLYSVTSGISPVSNRVAFEVLESYGVIANGSGSDGSDDTNFETVTIASANQAETIKFDNYIWNHGNTDDTFNITTSGSTFPAGSIILLFKSDGQTPLLDNDGDGNPDTGYIPGKGATCPAHMIEDSTNNLCGYKVVLKVILASDATGGPYQITKTATSSKDINQSNTVIDSLTVINLSSVDLTNNFHASTTAIPNANCDAADDNCAFGQWVSGGSVTTNLSGAPGDTVSFVLYVTNTSALADKYILEYSATDFTTNTVPTGWDVVFEDEAGNELTSTDVVAPNGNVKVIAKVTIPNDATLGDQDIYFKAISQSSGVFDIKRDSVTVSMIAQCYTLTTDQTGFTYAGGSAFYTHKLTNPSANTFGPLAITTTTDPTDWSVVVYEDTDGSGDLNGADALVTNVPTLTANQVKLLFVKVISPANAPQRSQNTTILSVSGDCDGTALTVENTDVTTVANTNVQISKLQGPDRDCNGVIDAGESYSGSSFSVEPNQCVSYLLTASNIGVEDAFGVSITDASPAFTEFINVSGVTPIVTQGTVTNVSAGSTGSIIADIGVLAPSEEASLTFGIKVQ